MKLAFLAFLSTCLCLAADVTGKWKGQLTTPNGDVIQITYDFKQDGTKLSGTVTTPQGELVPITEGKVEDNKIAFVINVEMNGGMRVAQTGTVTSDNIDLDLTVGDQPHMSVKLSRATT